jgi:exopolyphosphatase/guanosine-5'-triphosphate,3'-diphosphate pyrophosphatase
MSMKNLIITTIQGKSYKDVKSPNPMGKAVATKAVNLAQYYAEIHIPNLIKKKAGNLTVLGIGGVHYYSVRKQCIEGGKTYTISDVKRALAIGQALSDHEISEDIYAASSCRIYGNIKNRKNKSTQGKYGPRDSDLSQVLGVEL